jgi:hypothetical protein
MFKKIEEKVLRLFEGGEVVGRFGRGYVIGKLIFTMSPRFSLCSVSFGETSGTQLLVRGLTYQEAGHLYDVAAALYQKQTEEKTYVQRHILEEYLNEN